MTERRKLLHFSLWLAVGGATFFALSALTACSSLTRWVASGAADASIAGGTHALQGVATLLGQPWAIPILSAGGTALAGILHAAVGIPGVKAIPGTRAHRKRAVKKAQRDAKKAGVAV